MAPSSALPIGATRVLSEMQPVLVDPAQPGSGLLNAILALLAPPNPEESERYDEEVLDLTAVGFLAVYVPFHLIVYLSAASFLFDLRTPLAMSSEPTRYSYLCRNGCSLCSFGRTAIDIPNRKMTVLAPTQGSFAGRTAIIGSFEWQEQ